MANIFVSDLNLAGAALFDDAEGFMTDISPEELGVSGGGGHYGGCYPCYPPCYGGGSSSS